MRLVPPEKLISLQRNPDNIRNLCILAHVDHGKTTLADSLIASNGVISSRLAGTLRYMDSRPDEQERGITMKTSAISLLYLHKNDQYLINLLDSPGHVDFGGEVSTAIRLCEGAFVVVDVVEGLCPQTIAVLRLTRKEKIQPLLVLNKIDRLILELKLTPAQAYRRLQMVLEQVNAIAGELFLSEAMQQHERQGTEVEMHGTSKVLGGGVVRKEMDELDNVADASSDAVTIDDLEQLEREHSYFTPEQGNVIFASAFDGWGFRLSEFAALYSQKIPGLKEAVLAKTLWGDFYFDAKAKRIHRGAFQKDKKPLFVQLVLENIWAAYEAVMTKKDKDAIEKITRSLSIELNARDLRQLLNEPRALLKTIMCQWLPLASSLLTAACIGLPSPKQMSAERVEQLMCYGSKQAFSVLPEETRKLKHYFLACDSSGVAPVIAYISKMFAYETSSLPNFLKNQELEIKPDNHANLEQGDADHVEQSSTVDVDTTELTKADAVPESSYKFMAFARVFSGTVTRGQTLYVLSPKHDPELITDPTYVSSVARAQVKACFIMMGRELELVDCVPAGNILAIYGLDEFIMKSGTISSTLACPPFAGLIMDVPPIVRVAVEPKNSADMPLLVEGLRLLNLSDPCVRTFVESSGEHVLLTAGEVHLQRCLDDLRERFANVELVVSEPIIPFMETIVDVPKANQSTGNANSSDVTSGSEIQSVFQYGKSITIKTANKAQSFTIKALPLPSEITTVLEKHEDVLRIMEKCLRRESDNITGETDGQAGDGQSKGSILALSTALKDKWKAFRKELGDAFRAASEGVDSDSPWATFNLSVDKVWAFGPQKARHNILFNCVPDYANRPTIFDLGDNDLYSSLKNQLREFDQSVINGFQLRCTQGPLCEEPLRSVAFVIEQWANTSIEDQSRGCYGPLSGQIIATAKEGCKRAFQRQPQRLVLAMYNCVIQATADVLGKVYAVIARRFGNVTNEEIAEGSNVFQISATLPVVESFGFSEEFRKRTSGLASPQLVFSHWEVLDIDPFWIPHTEEELEHFGDKADSENRARKYMNSVKRRKGLKTDEKIVESAEKQRTLTKMK